MPRGVYIRTEETKAKLQANRASINWTGKTEENSAAWKEKVSYSGIHRWIAKKLGKPKQCSSCGFTSDNSRQFHWANISGNYLRDVADWVRLCVSCHNKMDDFVNKSWKTRKANI